jgi:hypothetical protein
MWENWLSILSIILWIVVPTLIFIARHWLIAWVSGAVQHNFDRQIEEVRADLRKSEERYKSELRGKEAEIAALRDNVLAGSTSRQALLDKRRFEAVEKVWTSVNDLAQLKTVSATLAAMNYKAIIENRSDPKIDEYLSTLTSISAKLELKDAARDERPFVSELAWGYFTAYKWILHANSIRLQILKNSNEEPSKHFSDAWFRPVLKAVLPHRGKFINESRPEEYHHLLEEIEGCLLTELRKILEGKEADQNAAARAKEIMDAIRQQKLATMGDASLFSARVSGTGAVR